MSEKVSKIGCKSSIRYPGWLLEWKLGQICPIWAPKGLKNVPFLSVFHISCSEFSTSLSSLGPKRPSDKVGHPKITQTDHLQPLFSSNLSNLGPKRAEKRPVFVRFSNSLVQNSQNFEHLWTSKVSKQGRTLQSG